MNGMFQKYMYIFFFNLSQLSATKKTSNFWASQQTFGPCCFARAIDSFVNLVLEKSKTCPWLKLKKKKGFDALLLIFVCPLIIHHEKRLDNYVFQGR